ncbi:coniferyl aldehyde dehydrogenase [Marinomonas profundimaris]|uniref:Aldehyde dehydrogenase n=1 Tax=Marinomonas profundimaris TaxID=1208321 RepID=W1RNS7_9GAMM|nr:coniferyl aldehyde dehydrogenase [Marinomonas profundimaris]ETI58117.1 coniferyl aldehyde dehydrogenase [Marinomonas profundimaris]
MTLSNTKSNLLTTLNSMKQCQLTTGPADANLRKDRLQRSILLIKENHQALSEAMNADFGHRSIYQSSVADLATTIKMLQYSIDNLSNWMKDERIEEPAPGVQAWIQQQPLGVIGIISPWNFPINLAFGPLSGVFAAGNTAMLKPSELTPKTSALLAKLVSHYFAPEELTVILGDAEVGQAFSSLPFDHLVFTGSTAVGKHVMRAAAENLVPVTLELGGKSPVMVDEDADIVQAAERTLTIKTFNVGQICLAPDYMLMPQAKVDTFVEAAKSVVQNGFPCMQNNADYTAIINERHYQRLIGLLEDATNKGATVISLAPQGEVPYDKTNRKIAPHLVLNVTDDMAIMQEEIFGPLLPIKTYSQPEEAINYINANPRPLAAYYFGNNSQHQHAFAHSTTSGGLVINDVMTHVSIESLPFGGVGPAGMGAYHGVHGFRRFTHAKAVVLQSEDGASNLRLRAPYHAMQPAIEAFLNS